MSKTPVVMTMEVPSAVVVFDRPRTMRLNVAAQLAAKRGLRELRKAGGAPDAEVYDFEILSGSLEAAPALVWGCLIHEDPDLTVHQVAEWLHSGNLPRVSEVLREMAEQYMPPKEEGAVPLEGGGGAGE